MLKRVYINKRLVPVPIPIRNMAELCQWIESNMIPAGNSVTKVMLNGASVDHLWSHAAASAKTPLTKESQVDIHIESPVQLSVQALDAMHNLSSVILRGLKHLAVGLWQAKPSEAQPELNSVVHDVNLILDLMDHLAVLIDPNAVDCGPLVEIKKMLTKITHSLDFARSQSDWRSAATILLRDTNVSKGLETLLRDLVAETESIQLKVLALRGMDNDFLARLG